MPLETDVRPVAAALYFLPVTMRMPLKFGPETVTSVTCARVRLTIADRAGRRADGWGETPLSVTWVWPSKLPYESRHQALKACCVALTKAWATFDCFGHPLEIGHDFQEHVLPSLLQECNAPDREPMPHLAALVCCSAFDVALHDAYGVLHNQDIYNTYHQRFLNRDLAHYLKPSRGCRFDFRETWPGDFLVTKPPSRVRAWHLVGGLDPLDPGDLTGNEPDDGYPVLLSDWIERDGLRCLKVKLRGTDFQWDFQRLLRVGQIASDSGADWLSADFNCTVTNPAYVNSMLDHLRDDHPSVYGRILYVEQPFPYDLEANHIDVHGVSARKPLFLDESAHDWRLVRLGRSRGWSGVALKTCKTQTGAILSLCWAKAHDMPLMVQDLTNPMLALIPHIRLAAHGGTIMGVETNAMQFYPEASRPEAAVHPGLYQRRGGCVDLATIGGVGFGYRLSEIKRNLPAACTANS
jgi:L-alanine-DL-glutamate epimerase-like enolase superfamily enzyme